MNKFLNFRLYFFTFREEEGIIKLVFVLIYYLASNHLVILISQKGCLYFN